MQCDICHLPIDLSDINSSIIERNEKIDVNGIQNEICPKCYEKALCFLNKEIEEETEKQELLQEQIYKIKNNEYVTYIAERPQQVDIKVQMEKDESTVESSEVQNDCKQDEYSTKGLIDSEIYDRIDIELLFRKSNFEKPDNFDQLNVLIERLALLFKYLEVPNVIPALPYPIFYHQNEYYQIYFEKQQKMKSKMQEEYENQLRKSAVGFSLMLQSANQFLRLDLEELFNSQGILSYGGCTVLQGDLFETWGILWSALDRIIEQLWKACEEQQNQIEWGQ